MLGYCRAFSFQSYLNPSLLRRQPLIGAHRPLTSFGSGVPSASTFFGSLVDADGAALKRLINEPHQWITETSFRGSLFFITVILSIFWPLFVDEIPILPCLSIKTAYFEDSANSELALVKLIELFNHSSIAITKRYLGLRQEEILETYDCLTF